MSNKNNADLHHRRSIRLWDYDYSQSGAYFVTICTLQKECLFGDVVSGEMRLNDIGRITEEEWLRAATVRQNVMLDGFVIMPNHIHGIIVITSETLVGATRRVAATGLVSGSLGAIIGQFKSVTAKRINILRKTSGASIWQRNYYEHVIRDEGDLNRIREYIVTNPICWGEDKENPIIDP